MQLNLYLVTPVTEKVTGGDWLGAVVATSDENEALKLIENPFNEEFRCQHIGTAAAGVEPGIVFEGHEYC